MTLYRTWSATGNTTNPANAYDGSYGDVSTYANLASSLGTSKSGTFQNTTSLTGMSSVVLKIRRYCTVGEGLDTTGSSDLYYSWDGTTWYWLTGGVKTDTTEETFSLGNFNSSTNLSSLRVRMDVSPGSEYDVNLNKQMWFASTFRTYDLGVEVTAGPVLTVNAISGSTSVSAGYSAQYSTTVTNDSTNNCTWSIVSGGGSLSGAVNDGTSTRVTWTAPNASGGTAVLRCTSNIDSGKYAQITISIPAISITLTVGPSRVRAGGTGWYQVTVTGTPENRAVWSATGGSFDTTYSNSVNWTAPSTPGKYIISGYHPNDSSKTFSYAVYVDMHYPSTYATSSSDAAVNVGLSGPQLAYNENSADYAFLSADWGGAGGYGQAFFDYYAFPDVPNVTVFDLVVDAQAYSTEVYYSINGGSWVYLGVVDANHSTPKTFASITPGGSFNLNQVKVRYAISCGGEYQWNPDTMQSELVLYSGYAYLYEMRAIIRGRAYTPSLGYSNRGTTPSPLYMPSLFNPVNGVMGSVGMTPVAIGSGVGQIPFFLGGNPG